MLVTARVPVSAVAVAVPQNLSVAATGLFALTATGLFALTVNLVGFIGVRLVAIVSRHRCFRCASSRPQ